MHSDSPNLLLVMADQLRHDWLGVANTEGVRTPNVDSLARRGVRFTHAVTNSAICAPARISLASGQRPSTLQAYGNDALLRPETTTYYQRLRDHGYQVGVVGKLDLAKNTGYNGCNGDRPAVFSWGFTHPLEAEGKMHAAGQGGGRPLGPYGRWLDERGLFQAFAEDYSQRLKEIFAPHRGGTYTGDGLFRDSVLPAEAFEDQWLGERAVRWIEEISGDFPWHLFVSFVGPHDPFDPPTVWADQFRDVEMPEPIPASPAGKPGFADPSLWGVDSEHVAVARRQYSGALGVIDDQVGHILSAIDDRGFADNTVVVFTSDHGEMLGDHGLFQKSVAYEAAMRVPLIVAGPGIPAATSDALIELQDLNPTLCELAGLKVQPGIDARSFAELLPSPGIGSHRPVVTCTQLHYEAVRTERYKYIHNTGRHSQARDSDIDELYDLAEDPGETVNLLLEDPSAMKPVIEEMRAHHHEQIAAPSMPRV